MITQWLDEWQRRESLLLELPLRNMKCCVLEIKFRQKNLWGWNRFFARILTKNFSVRTKNWKRWTLDNFLQKLQTTGSCTKACKNRSRNARVIFDNEV